MAEDIVNKITKYLRNDHIFRRLGLKDIHQVRYLAQGEYNRNFLIIDSSGRQLVFRMNYGSQINVKRQARYEFNALKILSRTRHTPMPIFLDDNKKIFNHDILIEQFLPGQSLNYSTDLYKAAEIFASIHSLKLSSEQQQSLISEDNLCFDRISEAKILLDPVYQTNKLSDEQKQIVFDLLDWCLSNNQDAYFSTQSKCMVNTEVNSSNFLITDNYGCLIDWEKPVYSNAVQDLTQFMAETTTLFRSSKIISNEDRILFIKKYAELTDQSSEKLFQNIQHYMPFLLLRALSWCAMLVTTYEDKPIKNPNIYHKCRDFLNPKFSLPLLKKYGVNA